MSADDTELQRRNDDLLRRVHELEDLQQRAEAEAAKVIAVAEELELARLDAERASLRERRSAALTKAVFDTVSDGILTVDCVGVIESTNRGVDGLFGYDGNALVGLPITTLVPSLDLSQFGRQGVAQHVECQAVRRDGACFHAEVSLAKMRADDGGSFACMIRDISERKEAEVVIRDLALHDTVTGLANRNLFAQRLEAALAGAQRRQQLFALVLLDLDKFKEVNDTYGHPLGDALLTEVAAVLRRVTRDVDTVARLGGDEFGILVADLDRTDDVSSLLGRILEGMAKPFVIDGTMIQIGASIGVSFYPNDDSFDEGLLKKADLALYQAKAAGRNCYRFYDDGMYTELRARKAVETDIRLGLVRDEFVLHYQPQVNAGDREFVGMEALVRWQHPRRGLMPPGEFIPIAEDSNLIVELGQWVLRKACLESRRLQDAGLPSMPTAVNISARQLQSDGFLSSVEAALIESGLEPSCLEIEITESMVMEDLDELVEKLRVVNALGVAVTIDDFGTGYSSLMHLKRFPVQKLKIDRSFVQNINTSRDDAAISQAVINLGHDMGLSVIAEGVETVDQIALLQQSGCDQLQGFHVGRPMPFDGLLGWHRETSVQQAQWRG